MLIYGDRSDTVDPCAYGRRLAVRCDEIAAWAPGFPKTSAVVEALIEAGKLVQGIADAAFEADGCERWDSTQALAVRSVQQIAMRAASSWSGFANPVEHAPFAGLLSVLSDRDLPQTVTIIHPEGYAFYAVYPELYLERAGGAWPPKRRRVIGLRSIGVSLAAAADPWSDALTLRPVGDPFARELRLGPSMRDALLAPAPDGYLVIDEGPGASGSSFGAVGDVLEDAGVPPQAISYRPSHAGDLGPQASERHRARWRTAKKTCATFEEVILPRLPGWTEPLIGPLTEPLRDLSGGLWRQALGVDAPAWPEQERRKHLATSERGCFVLRFAGLGGAGARKLERARTLHEAGFTPEPMGLAHGFLVERLLPSPPVASPAAGPAIDELGAYLGLRARVLPPPQGAASDDLLRTMMRRNLGLVGLSALAEAAGRLATGERGPPCAIDGRLHAWEWRREPGGRLIKLDALDHCEAHDLVGSQDVAWDLAGAAIEFALSPDAAERLRRITAAAALQAIDHRRVSFQTLAYLAFQIGWWTLAARGCDGARAGAEVDRYRGLAARWRPRP